MTRTILLAAAVLALTAGCATTFEGKFENEVACVDEERMTFTSWWFSWLGISAKVSPGSAKQHCGKVLPIILQVPKQQQKGSI